jgi:hypothetical protein
MSHRGWQWRQTNRSGAKIPRREERHESRKGMALLSYRSSHAYNLTQKNEDDRTDNFRASSYRHTRVTSLSAGSTRIPITASQNSQIPIISEEGAEYRKSSGTDKG